MSTHTPKQGNPFTLHAYQSSLHRHNFPLSDDMNEAISLEHLKQTARNEGWEIPFDDPGVSWRAWKEDCWCFVFGQYAIDVFDDGCIIVSDTKAAEPKVIEIS